MELRSVIDNLKEAGLNSEQIFKLLMKKEKTRQIELEIILLEKKRKFSDQDDDPINNKKKKLNELSSSALCKDVWINILTFLPGLEGFRMMLLCKQVMQATNYLREIEFDVDVTDTRLKQFVFSPHFAQIQSLTLKRIAKDTFMMLLDKCENIRSLKAELTESMILSFPLSNSNVKNLQTLDITSDYQQTITNLNSYFFNLENLKIPTFKSKSAYLLLRSCTNNIQILEMTKLCLDLDPKQFLPNLKEMRIESLKCSSKTLLSLFEIKTLLVLDVMHYAKDNDNVKNNDIILESKMKHLTLGVSDDLCEIICKYQFPELKSLILHSAINMNSAKHLANNSSLTNLHELNILTAGEDEFKSLCRSNYLHSLRSLTVEYEEEPNISYGLDYITESKSFSNLKVMDFTARNPNLDMFSSASKFSTLQQLELRNTEPTSLINLAKSKHFPNLRILIIQSRKIVSKEFIEDIFNNEAYCKLRRLGICIDDTHIPILVQAKNCKLQRLEIIGNAVTNVGAKMLHDNNISFKFF